LDADANQSDTPTFEGGYEGGCKNDGVVDGNVADGEFDATLAPGWHTILVQLYDDGGTWDFTLFMDPPPGADEVVVQVAGEDPIPDEACPCEKDPEWKNHGAYVSCNAHATNLMVKDGSMTGEEKGQIMSSVGANNCGKKRK
jgi:hypothetical protein